MIRDVTGEVPYDWDELKEDSGSSSESCNFYETEQPITYTNGIPDVLNPFNSDTKAVKPTKKDLTKLKKSEEERLSKYRGKLRREFSMKDYNVSSSGELTIKAERDIDIATAYESERMNIHDAFNLFKKPENNTESEDVRPSELENKISHTLINLKQLYPEICKRYPTYIEDIGDSENERIFDTMLSRFYDLVERQEKMDEFKDTFDSRLCDKNHKPTDIESQAHVLFGSKETKQTKASRDIKYSFKKIGYAFSAFFAALKSDFSKLNDISDKIKNRPISLQEFFNKNSDSNIRSLREQMGLK